MLGSEVGERIASLRPDLPIIATSGFAEEIGCPRTRAQRIFLAKPFGAEQLAAALDKAVAADRGVVGAPVM
jgi:CheY-like chemotaxis protein